MSHAVQAPTVLSPSTPAPASGFGYRYWLIIALETGALFGWLAVVNGVLHGKVN